MTKSSRSAAARLHLHSIGGNIHLDYRWGWPHREKPLTDDQVRAIRNSKAPIRKIAKQYDMTIGGIRSVLSKHRYKDVPDIPHQGKDS